MKKVNTNIISLMDLERSFKNAKNINELNLVLQHYLNDAGISTFAFTYYSYYPNSLNKVKFDFASSNYIAWHNHYISEGYEEVDSTLEDVYKTTLPTFWDLQTQLKSAKSAKEKKMRLDSIKFGIERGLSIPIHGPQEDFAILLLAEMRNENSLKYWHEEQYKFFSVAYYYYSYLQPLLLKIQSPTTKFNLKKREIQCLLLIAKECSVAQIAKKLHITERTVNYHIQKINKKLGTKNKYQSVSKAIQKKLIKL